MKRTLLFVSLVCFLTPAYAGFRAEKINEGVYFVFYECDRWTNGSVLDTTAKALMVLHKKCHSFCLSEGYSYMKLATMAEVVGDDSLSGVSGVAIGYKPTGAFHTIGDDGLPTNVHKSSRFLLLSAVPTEGSAKCID